MKRKNVSPLPQCVTCGVGSKNHPDVFGAHAGFRVNSPSVDFCIQTVPLGGLGECFVNRLSIPLEQRVIEVGDKEGGCFHIIPLRE